MMNNLQHAEDHMLLLGRKTSLQRVAAFLIEMDRRLTAAGVMPLPMSGRDIAESRPDIGNRVSRTVTAPRLFIIEFIGSNQGQIILLHRRQLAHLDLRD